MNDGISRRGALAIGAAAVFVASAAEAADSDPVAVLSTWDFGKAANEAALARFKAGGSVLDAVEAGAKVPEADPTNH